MVLSVFLHMARVFYHGAYKPPREFNWVIGVILLLLTLLLSFTGYLLPWDQLALWAVTVGTNMMGYTPVFGSQVKFVLLGGVEIGPSTLLRWYVLHVLLLPFVIVIFMAIHFWRVRQDVKATPVDKVHVWPHLLVGEFVASLAMTAFLLVFSVFVNAPLLANANYNFTPNPSKAPWYFLGLQELLTMFHPMVAGVTIPGIGIFGLILAPFTDRNPSHKPEDRKFAISLFTVFLMFWAVLVIIGSFFRGPGFNFTLPWRDGLFFDL